jgi:flagellar biogenesis protein FliO
MTPIANIVLAVLSTKIGLLFILGVIVFIGWNLVKLPKHNKDIHNDFKQFRRDRGDDD